MKPAGLVTRALRGDGGDDVVGSRRRDRVLADDGRRRLLAAADARRRDDAHVRPEQRRQPRQQLLRAGHLARQAVADAHGERRRRGLAFLDDVEVVIEGRDLVHLGLREASSPAASAARCAVLRWPKRSWILCRCSISRSLRRGASPSSARTSRAAPRDRRAGRAAPRACAGASTPSATIGMTGRFTLGDRGRSLQQPRAARPLVLGAEHRDRDLGRVGVRRDAVLVEVLRRFLDLARRRRATRRSA